MKAASVKPKTTPRLNKQTKKTITPEKKPTRPVGRPKAIIDYNLVKSLAQIHCTQEEIASFMDIAIRTLQQDEEFMRIYKKGIETGKSSLRRLQWKEAEAGNITMLVWLGKQLLKQTDKQDIINSGTTKVTMSDEYRSLLKDVQERLKNESRTNKE